MTVRFAPIVIAAVVVAACSGAPIATTSPTTTPSLQPASAAPVPTATLAQTPSPASATPGAPPSAAPVVIAKVHVGAGPCAMAELDGSVWVTNYTDNTLVRADGATNAVVQTVKVGTSPCGIAVANGKLWVAVLGDRAVVEVDPSSGKIEHKIDVGGQGWDVQAGFGSIWVAIQGPDKIVRIDPASASVVATIVGAGPLVSGIAITPDQVWVANQGGKTISRIDPTTNAVVASIDLPAAPFWFAVGDKSILVTLSNANQAVGLDPRTGEPGAPINVGTKPRDPGFVNGSFWVANQASGDVTVVDGTSSAVEGSFQVAGSAGVFVAEHALGDGWVLDYAGTSAYRIAPDAGSQ